MYKTTAEIELQLQITANYLRRNNDKHGKLSKQQLSPLELIEI